MKDELLQKIETSKALMLYIGGEHCSVCKALYPKVTQAFLEHFPKMEQLRIDIENEKEFVSSLQVFVIPTIIVYFEGKEFFRKSRNLSVDMFIDEVERPYTLFVE
ncbi:MAG: thioredoxin family protein [Arcobacteraceae bacterium]|jgi:thioredoxin-like negative regulator of GroEL|nr:thioredoxin family protein [Arcobacteraceae bacterium]